MELYMSAEHDIALQTYARLMLEHLPVGTALFDADDLRLLAANTIYHALHKPEWRDGSVLGYTLPEILAEVPFPADAIDKIVVIFRRVVETGVHFRVNAYAITGPTRGVTYWDWALEPITEHGQVSYVLLTVTDVTSHVIERRHAEEAHLALTQTHQAVEIERERLHTILDQLPEGVLLVDARTSAVSYANPAAARHLGFALPQLIGTPLNQPGLLSPHSLSDQNQKSASRWNFVLIDALWGKITTNQELLVTRPDGSEVTLLSSVAPIRTTKGLITEAVIVFQDITKLKRLEQEKNEFFAIANHELRTPLTVILGFAELLQMTSADNAGTMNRYALQSIAQECTRLIDLLHGFLDVARLERTELDLKRSSQDLLQPLKQMFDRYWHTTQTHRLYLKLENLPSDGMLVGEFDIPRVEQVLSNLLANAIKYSPADSEIELGVRPGYGVDGQVQEVLIWVKDQGVGIAAADLPHIFERFYRASTLDPSISGFGIGLYLTRELVKGHGGRIWVESKLNQGSTFFLTFPLGGSVVPRS
jgi:PAS domain S-box-containing protein